MAEIDPVNAPETAGASPAGSTPAPAGAFAAAPATAPVVERSPASSVLVHLHSLQELHLALAHETREPELLRLGCEGAVEMIGADCGIALLDPSEGYAGLRYGWSEGRRLAQHEIEVFSRRLEEPLTLVRAGKVPRVKLAVEPVTGDRDWTGEPPAALQSRGFGSVLVLGVGIRAGQSGALILARRDPEPLTGEKALLAEMLALQMSINLERIRRAEEARRAGERLQIEFESTTRALQQRNQELAAVNAVAAAVGPALDLDRQIDLLLRKAIEGTRHAAGALYLVDQDEGGEEVLRFARGVGEPDYPEPPPDRPLRRGEEVPGGVWETGRPAVVPDLATADVAPGGGGARQAALTAAGYRRLLGLPLRARGRTIGVMKLLSKEPREYGEAEVSLARAIADQIAIAVQSCRLFSDMMRHSLDLEARVEMQAQELARREKELALHDVTSATPGAAPVELPAPLVQAQKMESIGVLAGGIAHDFNNILGAILGYASNVKSLVSADNPIHHQAATIERQALRAADLTQQLLTFARGSQHTLEPVDLNRVVAETVSFLSKSIDRAITLEVHSEPDLPAIEADPSQMKQILLNVAVNARDALPKGGRIAFETRVAHLDERYVQAYPGLAPGDYVEVLVQDTGVGMQPEVVDRVFEPFFTTKPDGEGSGLGLSVVYGIVKNHKGHVTISSTAGVGTTVRLYLPASRRAAARLMETAGSDLEPAPSPAPGRKVAPEIELTDAVDGEPAQWATQVGDPEEVSRPEPFAVAREDLDPERSAWHAAEPPTVESAPPTSAPTPRSVTAEGRILVVDDEEALRELARDILQGRGYDVIFAKDGVDALEVYRQNWGRVSLVLLDMVMPRLGGLETFRRLLGIDRTVRVLLCSGYTPHEQARQAIREGALGLLPKPYTMTELIAWVERLAPRSAKAR
ncbi:MAG TPA: GAF domain-containing protein [Candidatus Polarisedimenticolia bacterium]|nr:GAF domain-containing protein [Candidatus Polarisedimenticolia bacterium]